jgi:hypothetical protein
MLRSQYNQCFEFSSLIPLENVSAVDVKNGVFKKTKRCSHEDLK